VALALTFDLPESASRRELAVSAFLGICETICIPVQADFRIDLGDGREASADHEVVEHAFAALPRAAGPDFGARLRVVSDQRLLIDVAAPKTTAAPELFITSTEEWAFDVPKLVETADGAAFEVPVLAAPDSPSARATIHYTLVAGEDAVSGTFEIAR
jgi:DsbC/DsbD-like thiol-disulfide interchange protein